MNTPDLNCDLGEHESLETTAALMTFIDSANIACGGHAGDLDSMQRCIDLCLEHGVHIGAHPGLCDNGGRGNVAIDIKNFVNLLDKQVLPFASLVQSAGGILHHIKLHGSLYHATDQHADLAYFYLDWCADRLPDIGIYARSGGSTARLAKQRGMSVWRECFLDRAYESDGSLRSRQAEGAVFQDLQQLYDRLILWQEKSVIAAHNGSLLALPCDTFCLHSDSPQALAFAAAARKHFSQT